MEYRQLIPADVQAFRHLRIMGLRSDPDSFLSTPEEEENQPIAAFLKRIESNFALGVFAANIMVGVALLSHDARKKRRHIGEVKAVFVSPELRGKGIGRGLMEELEKHARTLGIEQLELNVIDTNQGAIQLYRNLGYQEFGTHPRAFKHGSSYLGGIYMVKFLNS